MTHSHSPLRFSFQSVTRLSPPLTARTLPLRLQLTRQRTASKLRTVLFHPSLGEGEDGDDDDDDVEEASQVQIRTVLSWLAEAM